MKYKSTLLASASGSVAGATFSRNGGGSYIRARAVPTNPQTAFQQEVRAALGNLATSWAALSEEQREGWRQYAANVPLVDTLGDARPITGLAMYNRSNVPRIQAGLAAINDAPSIFNLGDTPVITGFAMENSGGPVSGNINVDVGDTTVALTVLAYYSRPLSPTIVYFKGPFRYAGLQAVAAAASSTTNLSTAYNQGAPAAGTQVAVRIRVTRADGRLSQDAIARVIVTSGA